MNEWTLAARRVLEEHLSRHRARFAAGGAEAEEVAADLRRHVEHETTAKRLRVVTEDDVRRILARVDPQLLEPGEPEPGPPPHGGPRPEAPRPGVGAKLVLWLFGVLLPLGTMLTELFLRLCTVEFFDPMPTWLHVALVVLVPAANAGVLLFLEHRDDAVPRWLWWVHSMGLGVAGIYALLFLPMMPLAFIGILFFGFGFLPLAPILAWICATTLGGDLQKRADFAHGTPPRRRWLGWAGVMGLLVLLAAPAQFSRHWLQVAATGTEAERTAAVRKLRAFGSEEYLLRAAYGQFGRGLTELFGARRLSAEEAQQVYFRVTGLPFNAVQPPLSRVRGVGRSVLREFEWDNALGGETVAGRVSGLSLLSSRLDASANADDGWGYSEWTLEFRNDHPNRQREARAMLQLPPGGVVSRVTLWVNGEEREAAFAGRGQVRAAYQSVAVVQRRDPILVTTAGPDRVLMQCFPVPADGGTMKVRLGVTAPLVPLATNEVGFLWPRMVERNFAIREELRHHAWLEAMQDSADIPQGWQPDAGRAQVLHAAVRESEVGERFTLLRLKRTSGNTSAWAKDDRDPDGGWVRQRLETGFTKTDGRLAIVLDGGRGSRRWFDAMRAALATSRANGDVAIWVAHDGAREVFRGEAVPYSQAGERLARWSEGFAGGHDPVPALEAAWDWAGVKPGGTVLWVHGALPVPSADFAAIRQRLERASADSPRWVDVIAEAGPNRFAELLDGIPGYSALTRLGPLPQDLARYLGQRSGGIPVLRWVREHTTTEPDDPGQASRHLVRLWGAEQVEALRRQRKVQAAVDLAARWQLVTSVSGAVVLETRQQFAQHGLTPADPATAPTVVPEPETWALFGVGTVLLWLCSLRSRRRRSPSA